MDTLGVTKVGDFKSEKENVDEDILVTGKGRDTQRACTLTLTHTLMRAHTHAHAI